MLPPQMAGHLMKGMEGFFSLTRNSCSNKSMYFCDMDCGSPIAHTFVNFGVILLKSLPTQMICAINCCSRAVSVILPLARIQPEGGPAQKNENEDLSQFHEIPLLLSSCAPAWFLQTRLPRAVILPNDIIFLVVNKLFKLASFEWLSKMAS